MLLEEIEDAWSKDCKIDDTELDIEALKIPQLHNKYLKMFNRENLLLRKMNYDYKELEKAKFEYYAGKMDESELESRGWEQFDHRLLKQDVPRYIEGDADLIKRLLKIDYQKEKVDFLKSIISNINGRNFIITNAIKWRQFINGIGQL